MGLDEFRGGKFKKDDSDSKDQGETTTEDTEDNPEVKNENETPTQNGGVNNRDGRLPDLSHSNIRDMSKEERVQYIRDNHIPDYNPSFQPDESWSFKRTVYVDCSCGEAFSFHRAGACPNCNAKYKDESRTVVKVNEEQTDNTHGT